MIFPAIPLKDPDSVSKKIIFLIEELYKKCYNPQKQNCNVFI